MNVLLTSVGRRAYMVKYFKEALGPEGKVHVCNSDDQTVAFHYADAHVVSPLIYAPGYIPFLLDYCRDNQIHMLLSLFDIDLLVLARNKARFAEIGVEVVVSPPDFIEICNDKWNTYRYLSRYGFHTPRTFCSYRETVQALEAGVLSFPVVVKPRFGCGSISVAVAQDMEELAFLYKRGCREVTQSYLKYESQMAEKKMIFQQCLTGQEYGADIIHDLKGQHRGVIVRRKLAMRSGETDIAELVDEPAIEEDLTRLSQLTGHIGNLDCDIFLVDGVPYLLEMNARFGGGYPFSHMGGCDLPRALVKWRAGEEVEPSMLTARTGLRGYKEIYITRA